MTFSGKPASIVPSNPYESPKYPGHVPVRNPTLSSRAIARGFFVFLAAWVILATAANLVIPMDATGDPAIDAETARVGLVVGPIMIGASVMLGIIECYLVSRQTRR